MNKHYIRLFIALAAMAILLIGLLSYPPKSLESTSESMRAIYAPESPTLAGNFLAGSYAIRHNDIKNAADFFGRVSKLDPKQEKLSLQTFYLHLQNGELQQATDIIEHTKDEAILNDPFKPLIEIINAIKDNDSEMAILTLKDLADAEKNGPQVSFIEPLVSAWVTGLDKNTTTENMLALLEPMKRIPATIPFYHLHAGLIKATMDEDIDAIKKEFDPILASKRDLPVYFALVIYNTYLQLGQTEEAAKAYDIINKQANDFVKFSNNNLGSWLKENKPLSMKSGLAEALSSIGHALNFAPNSDYALVYGQLSLALRGNDDFTLLMVAEIQDALNRPQEALKTLSKFDRSSPFYYQALLHKADLYATLKQYDRGVSLLSKAVQQYPNSNQLYLELADIYRSQENFTRALEAYNDALKNIQEIEPKHWPIFYARGIVYERLGQWDKAEADLLKTLELNPNEAYVLNYLGYGWLERDMNKDRAINMIEKAVSLKPDDGHIVDSLGWAKYLIGDYSAAVKYLEKAVALSPVEAVINDHLGDAYWRMNRYREARFQWQRALNLDIRHELKGNMDQKMINGLPPLPKE